MAWESTTERKSGSFEITQDGWRATATYDVSFDAPATMRDAAYAPNVPPYGSQHPHQAFIFVNNVRAEPKDQARQHFVVSVTWGSVDTVSPTDGGEVTDPLSAPPKRSIRPVQVVEDIDHDISGQAIRNSAGEPYDPGLQRNYGDTMLTIQRNEADSPIHTTLKYLWKTNADPFLGFAPETCIMANIQGDENLDSSVPHWSVTYEIIIRQPTELLPNPWRIRTLDRGFRYLSGGKFVTAADPEGKPLNEPVLLDGAGGPIDKTLLGLSGDNTPPVWHHFRVYGEHNYGILALT